MALKGLFFWRKKTEIETAEEMMQLFLKYAPKFREMQKKVNEEERLSQEQIVDIMYDYYENAIENTDISGFDDEIIIPNTQKPESENKKIKATPKSVMEELERIPVPFDLIGIDSKIEDLSDKLKLSNQRYAKKQIDGLISRLNNRKKYTESQFLDFYTSFPNTNDEKIDMLLDKYELVFKKSELFIPSFPKDAIAVMKEYTRVTQLLCGKKPVFYVIAEAKDFEKKYEKLDPILLVQSPFGFYWQILGAWDKEMLLLSEL